MQEFANKFEPYTGILIVLIVAFAINRLELIFNRDKNCSVVNSGDLQYLVA